jgi:hypothetical protein
MRTFPGPISRSPLSIGLLAGVVVLSLIGCGGGAAADGDGGAETSACQSAARSELDEFGSAIAVSASLSRPPAVAGTAVLSGRIAARRAYEGAEIVVELPTGMAFVDISPEMRISRGLSFGGQAIVDRAVRMQRLDPGSPVRIRATVRATATGSGQVRIRVTAPTAGGVDAGSAEIFVTVGATAGESACRIDVPPDGGVTTVAMLVS